MKGFHLVVLLAAGSGIRDTQVTSLKISFAVCFSSQCSYSVFIETCFFFSVWVQDVY